MRARIFTFRYSSTLGGFDDEPLQHFLRDKELIAFREHFFSINEVPHLACVVLWQAAVSTHARGSQEADERPRSREQRPDPRSELDEPQRIRFESLREWRASKAHDEGVPPYVVFTNRQLVEIVRREPDNPTALGNVPGIGAAKVQRYGAELLRLLAPKATAVSNALVPREEGGS